jgi:hypothetical protein
MRLAVGIVILWLLIYDNAVLFKALHNFIISLVG